MCGYESKLWHPVTCMSGNLTHPVVSQSTFSSIFFMARNLNYHEVEMNLLWDMFGVSENGAYGAYSPKGTLW